MNFELTFAFLLAKVIPRTANAPTWHLIATICHSKFIIFYEKRNILLFSFGYLPTKL